jgi:radical SAM protein with 4Fe4S-binding SPASM domain
MALIPVDIYSHSFCPWGEAMLGVSHAGAVGLCHVAVNRGLLIFDHLKNNNIIDIWRKNEELQKFRSIDSNRLKGVCGNCLARSLCKGGCRLTAAIRYGVDDFYAPNPQCQNVYSIGEFPLYALENEGLDCSYGTRT